MAKKQTTKAKSTSNENKPGRFKHLCWIITMLVWVLLLASLLSYHPGDWPSHYVSPHNVPMQNWVGKFGAAVSSKIYLMLGPGIWMIMAGILAVLVSTAMGRKITQPIIRVIGTVILAIATSTMLGLIDTHKFGTWMINLLHNVPADGMQNPEGSGGLLAIFINNELTSRFSTFGTWMILIVGFWLGALLAVDQLVLAVPRIFAKLVNAITGINLPRPVLVGRFPKLWGRNSDVTDKPAAKTKSASNNKRKSKAKVDEHIDEDAGGYGGIESFDPEEAIAEEPDEELQDEEAVEQEAVCEEEEVQEEETDEEAVEEDGEMDAESLREKFKNLPINFAKTSKKKTDAPPREIDYSGYQFPGMDILVEPESNFSEILETWVREQAVELETTLQTYRIEGEVVGVDSGPVITLYEVRLAPGTKVSSVNAISSDIARAMKAQNIRVVANIPGKDTIGIEVPNLQKEKVRLKELMTVDSASVAKMRLPMFLGKDASGNPLVGDLTSMPHMLIAGTTGSGKSVCMNSIIMSFLFTKRPDELKLVLVDPKMVEMSQFKDIPHLMCPVVTDMNKAAAILEWAVTKMDERYALLAEAGVRDIVSYNELGWDEIKLRMQPATQEEEVRIPKKLPYMVFIIDELADLMMTNKEVETFIVRIAQKARAVGLHLILATQRPQANVVTGLIKSNMPCRVAFKVASGMDSRIVLDQKGAELLLGQGDMMYLSPRTSKISRAQGTLVDDKEIRDSVKFLKTVSTQNFETQLVQIKQPGIGGESNGERDELFDDAVRVVLESQRGSVSLLQRRLTIGYSRASRLIEEIADAGIIGEYKGSQAREVNMTLEEFEALKAQAEQGDLLPGGLDERPADTTEPDEAFEYDNDDDDSVPDEMDDEYRN
jgi:S-DNA-T family DNA segregation ATPase FtsK/SpoIIIE